MLEAEKYEKVWEHPEYRVNSPGESVVMEFLLTAQPEKGESIIDFGCGTGRAAKKLAEYGLDVTALDFAYNALDDDIDVPFVQADLTKHIPIKAKWGYCTDVMEHLPTEDVPKALRNILGSVEVCWFKIATFADHFGPELMDTHLHLTVEGLDWWKEQFRQIKANVVKAYEDDAYVTLLVSPWGKLDTIGKINLPEDVWKANIKANIEAGYQEATPSLQQDIEIMLLGGGPSLNEFEDDIRAKREAGMPLVTTNGTYKWCLDRGITPSAQVVLDGRAGNEKFVDPIVPGCKYLIASQCHPDVLKAIPKDQLYLWHSVSTEESAEYIKSIIENPVWPIPGGSTVILRAIPLLRMLGFPRFHIYGMDSCVDTSHHAYLQPENDVDIVVPVRVAGEEFHAAPWMISQAEEFRVLAKHLDADARLIVYGDGLIATLIRKAAELSRD